MDNSNGTKNNSKQESARLYLGELVRLVDELSHRNSMLRNDGREILDSILTHLEEHCVDKDVSRRLNAKDEQRALATARRALQADWLRVDALIDDLLSSAADELSQFASLAEARIGACERAHRHREISQSFADGSETT